MLRRLMGTVWVGWCIATACTAAYAEETPDPNYAAYLRYCSSCHGPNGNGDGTVAPQLTPKPTDLTQLAKKSGGEFDAVAVYDAISGSRVPAAHGTSAMPVWGEEMRERPGNEDLRANKLRIARIINYLRSIQQK